MATVLRRPMFKIGGSADGTGITSGLRRYGFAEPELVTQEDYEVAVDKVLNPDKPGYGWKELISDAYRTSRDAPTGKDWLMNAADLALERSDKSKEEAKAKVLTDLELMGNIRDKQFERKNRAFDEATTLRGMDQTDTQIEQGNRRLGIDELRLEIEEKRLNKPSQIEEQKQVAKEIMKLISEAGSLDDLLTSGDFIKFDIGMSQVMDNWKPFTTLRRETETDVIELLEKRTIPGTNMPQPYTPEEVAAEVDKRMRNYYSAYFQALVAPKGGNAMGGIPRNRYAMGMGPVMDQQTDMSMTENIDTPQGDMSMTENIDIDQMGQQIGMPAQTMPSDDPFVLLRARLPEEITDDVVRLIAYNPDAFADFADIETQDDVISFNKKWGVELVINTDEMSGAIA